MCRIEAETFEKLVTAALDQAGVYLFGTWLPAHGLTFLPFSAEKYFLKNDDDIYMEIWVMPAPGTEQDVKEEKLQSGNTGQQKTSRIIF